MITLLLLLQTCGYSDYHCPRGGYSSYEAAAPASTYSSGPVGYRVGTYGVAARGTGCWAVDGDTLGCTSTTAAARNRLRLVGIDAPELPGHCRTNRRCAPGDPYASKNRLQYLLHGTIRYDYLGLDKYGRQVALVKVGNTNVNCDLVRRGFAIYRRDWDKRHALWNSCSYVRQHYRF